MNDDKPSKAEILFAEGFMLVVTIMLIVQIFSFFRAGGLERPTIDLQHINNTLQMAGLRKYKSYMVIPIISNGNAETDKYIVVASNVTGNEFKKIQNDVTNQMKRFYNHQVGERSVVLKAGSNYQLYELSYKIKHPVANMGPKTWSIKPITMINNTMDNDNLSGIRQSINNIKVEYSLSNVANQIAQWVNS